MNKSVLVALSGGIDSTVAALILKEQGYRVYGLHFKLFDSQSKLEIIERLDIPVYFSDLTDLMEKTVIDSFLREYANGSTPCPCSLCNRKIKWGELYRFAKQLGIDYIATGHYVRRTTCKTLPRFLCGLDQ